MAKKCVYKNAYFWGGKYVWSKKLENTWFILVMQHISPIKKITPALKYKLVKKKCPFKFYLIFY